MEYVDVILKILAKLMEYSHFFAALGAFMLAGEIAKRIFTKEKAVKKGKYQWFWYRARQTLALHPIAAGVVLGLLDPTRGIATYALAGVLSTFLYDLIERLTKFDIHIPGEELSDRPTLDKVEDNKDNK